MMLQRCKNDQLLTSVVIADVMQPTATSSLLAMPVSWQLLVSNDRQKSIKATTAPRPLFREGNTEKPSGCSCSESQFIVPWESRL